VRSNRIVILLALVLILGAAVLAYVLLRNNTTTTAPPPIAGLNEGTSGPGTQVQITTTLPPPTPTFRVVAVRNFVAQGTLLTESDLQTVSVAQVTSDDILADDMGSALNHYTTVSINRGQTVKKAGLVDGNFSNYMRQLMLNKQLEPGKKAFPYATNDLSGVAGLIHEGDLIDVVATFSILTRPVSIPGPGGTPVPVRGAGSEPTTKTLLQNVRVLKVIQLQLDSNPFSVRSRPLPTPTVDIAAQTPIVVAGTAVPTPTLLPFSEAGSGFPVTTVLILAVDDQQAELLKFTRETKFSTQNCTFGGGDGGGNANGSAISGSITCVPTVHFLLRAKPLDPANPQDANVAVDPSRGVTFRALVRDYGLTIPDLVFATQAQQ